MCPLHSLSDVSLHHKQPLRPFILLDESWNAVLGVGWDKSSVNMKTSWPPPSGWFPGHSARCYFWWSMRHWRIIEDTYCVIILEAWCWICRHVPRWRMYKLRPSTTYSIKLSTCYSLECLNLNPICSSGIIPNFSVSVWLLPSSEAPANMALMMLVMGDNDSLLNCFSTPEALLCPSWNAVILPQG